jgi:WhiB family redox-sensing transcriptional regulator
MDVNLFFPEKGGQARNAKAARAACASCPVRAACLADALATGEQFGIRAGLSPQARRALRRSGAMVLGMAAG